jgi:hypothetical protein
MTKRILLGMLVLLCAFALVTPAHAITVGGVDYVFLAKYGILMEQSDDCPHILVPPGVPPAGKLCMNIQGAVGVSDVANPADGNDGRLRIGANNDIRGLVKAHSIVFATGSSSDKCEFDVSLGVAPVPPVCIAQPNTVPAVLPIVAAWPPGPLGAVPFNNCVNAGLSVTVPSAPPQGLAPGCYKDIRINAGGILNLSPGNYIFKTLRLLAGATLNGNGAAVNVQSLTITEAGAKLNDVTISTPGTVNGLQSVTEFISIGSGSTLTNVVLYAPTSAIHVHGGTNGTNVEVIANFITIEPVIIVNQVVSPECGCFEDVTHVANSATVHLGNGQNLLQATGFFLSADCNIAGAVTVNPTPGPKCTSNTDCDLLVSGKPAGNYHVIVQWNTGSYCNDTVVTLP